VEISKQITILIFRYIISRLVIPLNFIYSSLQVSAVLVLNVHCKLINFIFHISFYFWNVSWLCVIYCSYYPHLFCLDSVTTAIWLVSFAAIALNDQTWSTLECHHFSIRILLISLWNFFLSVVQTNLWMLECGNAILPTVRFLHVLHVYYSNSVIVTILCKLSFPIIYWFQNMFPAYFGIEIS
jgi:hypothetical protein